MVIREADLFPRSRYARSTVKKSSLVKWQQVDINGRTKVLAARVCRFEMGLYCLLDRYSNHGKWQGEGTSD
jgi:hypothetical protein|tara:strand:+ start:3625 stop:3837 length:213 start_codon:yes stop_codon:yes gene_type:complete